MRYTIYYLLIALSFPAIGQTFEEKEVKSNIKEVTLFLQGALINREATFSLNQGKTLVKLKALSPYIDEKSIQVKTDGDFTVLAVSHELNHLDPLVKNEVINGYRNEIDEIELEISRHRSRLEVLKQKTQLLEVNRKLGSESNGVSLDQIQRAMELYDREFSRIKSEEIDIMIAMEKLVKRKSKLETQIAETKTKKELPTGEINIRLEAKQNILGKLTVSYLVANAGWYPKYDVRVFNVAQPLQLNYRAEVYQNTGLDWNEVKLRFSNANPNQSSVAPELTPWRLNFARNTVFTRALKAISNQVSTVSGIVVDENGEPIPGANIIVKGTSVGTVTNVDGRYSITLPNGASQLAVSFVGYNSMDIPIDGSVADVVLQQDVSQLSEVVVVGYGSESALQGRVNGVQIRGASTVKTKNAVIRTTTIENQTTVEFEVDDPYTLKTNGEKIMVDLDQYEIETQYEYFAVPKLDKDAFLLARIINWDQYNLLEGEANLYFEDTYVGRSILDARSLNDTLDISLGRDKSIVLGREKVEDFSKRRTIGSNQIESRAFEIIARNKKSQPIQITIIDQIPVPVINDISVEATKTSGGVLEEVTGKIYWEMNLPAGNQAEIELAYEVKYPKRENVYLE